MFKVGGAGHMGCGSIGCLAVTVAVVNTPCRRSNTAQDNDTDHYGNQRCRSGPDGGSLPEPGYKGDRVVFWGWGVIDTCGHVHCHPRAAKHYEDEAGKTEPEDCLTVSGRGRLSPGPHH